MYRFYSSMILGFVAIFICPVWATAQPSGIDEEKRLLETEMVRLIKSNELDSALMQSDRWLKTVRTINDEHWLAKGWFYRGSIFLQAGDDENATIEFNKVLSSKLEWGDSVLLFKTLYNLGLAHKRMSNLSVASSYFHQALDILPPRIAPNQLAPLHEVLGNIQLELGNDKLAFTYHRKALALYKNANDDRGVAKAFTNLGNALYKTTDYDSALYYCNLSETLKLRDSSDNRLDITYLIIGKTLLALDSFHLACIFLQKALDTANQDDPLSAGYGYVHLAEAYLQVEKYDSAEMAITRASLLAERAKSKDLWNTLLQVKASKYELLGDHSQALKVVQDRLKLRDEILDEAKQRALTELEIQYRVQQTQSRLQEQKQQLQLADVKLEGQRFQIIALLLLALLALLVAFSWRQARNKQKLLKEQREAMLRELNHRVKNNHNALSGAISIQIANTTDAKELNALEEHLRRIEAINLLHINLSLDDGATTQVDFSQYIDKLTQSVIISSVWGNALNPKFELQDVSLRMDKAIPLGMIVNELLTNACKYAFTSTSKNKSILVKVSYIQDLVIEIRDNGTGLPSEIIPSESRTTGMMIIHGLASQLKASLHFENHDGLVVRITMKK